MSGRDSNEEREIARIKKRLTGIKEEKERLTTELNRLLRRTTDTRPKLTMEEENVPDEVHCLSPSDEKIRLFRSLFRGREDVYPRRWESVKTGRSGYSPACRHEWVPGICEKPRVKCGDCSAALPRGCGTEAIELLTAIGIGVRVEDKREVGTPLEARFRGTLDVHQERAVEKLRQHEIGVLVAPTAFGKTVVAARMIAERGRNTLVVVHRQQLLEQWLERLATFLDVDPNQLGRVGGGKRQPSGVIDVALIQSLVRRGEVDDLVARYGHLIVDECHHLSAVSFEAVARASHAKFVLGMTATMTRKDGHHPIVVMQCGPIRHRVAARTQADERPFAHRLERRYTDFTMPAPVESGDQIAIHRIYAAIAEDEARNDLIFDDVITALEAGRSPLVLTERRDHLEYLAHRFKGFAKNMVVLKGGMGKRQLQAALERLATIPDHEERLIIATGRYLGEGFDDARLDTLFLTMPISWKGTLAQYAGRLHRLHHGKTEVVVYDYVDHLVPALARMAERRLRGYRALGYKFRGTTPGEKHNDIS